MKIIRSNNKNQTKIIFLTHKEYLAITGINTWNKFRKIIFFHEYIYCKFKSFLNRFIFNFYSKKLRIKVKIIHWGVTLEKNLPHNHLYADLHLTDKKSTEKTNNFYKKKICLSLTSKDFEPIDYYRRYQDVDFKWDIITVSHNSRRKKVEDILSIIRKALDINKSLTALIIINTPSKRYKYNNLVSSIDFIKKYKTIFSYKERQQIVLLRISEELALEGASPSFIKWALSKSRIFLFASVKEGSAKVLTEAKNSGCIVLARKSLQGGSYDFLLKENLFLWENIKNAVDIILSLTSDNRKIDYFYNQESVKILVNQLKSNSLIDKNTNFDFKQFELANRWLPGHLEAKSNKYTTSDCIAPNDLIKFFKKEFK